MASAAPDEATSAETGTPGPLASDAAGAPGEETATTTADATATAAEPGTSDTTDDQVPVTSPSQEQPDTDAVEQDAEAAKGGEATESTESTEPVTPEPAQAPVPDPELERVNAQLAAITAALEPLEQLRSSVAELTRLRSRDSDLIDRLHGDNTRLRAGELATATTPLLHGLIRLHDQMSSIAAGDQHSVAGMLRTQLLQLLEVAAGVTSYEPNQGEPFDPSRHTGAARGATTDPALDNTVGRRIRPGFARADGSVLRVAEVEVLRHAPASSAAPSPSTDQKESQ
ncbi:nucleotide exchange factor GrpE [Terracoccus luteus]|uniref:Molecular chaperone GrpE (Heat shock protein) n=1 Tax=Terracoccus luteus TaxID=53356 RepID=A0A839Q2G2_9MICO|nr:nucleotide exchange factor GrpE [Terracoccus luteus]MBB2988456.1 molecular chaperone GrpE (heat shock protein) [Terracoccus luteus]MCP2174089.1 molecular chaperone GrpE (heat shock protein) [Terracoccus luteus]